MENFIIVAIILFMVGSIVRYLYKAKKRGQTCIGCPYSKQCGNQCNGNCQSTKSPSKSR